MQFLKFCLNLCSFKWLKLGLSRESNFTPFGSWIKNNNHSLYFINALLNFLIFCDCFVKLLNLLQLEIQNKFLNFSVFVLKVFNVIWKIFWRVLFPYFHYFTNPSSITDQFQICYLFLTDPNSFSVLIRFSLLIIIFFFAPWFACYSI